jgi:hypothetical protein
MRKRKCIRPSSRRRMQLERLENRSLMAADLYHNFILPEDTDGSGAIDPLDALVVINQLNQDTGVGVAREGRGLQLVDVDADNALTPLDVLVVINQLNSITSADGRTGLASRVETTRRIDRIERAIASNRLPVGMTVDAAEGILETLQSGGRPELGDRVIQGLLHWKQDIIPAILERVEDPSNGDPTGDPTGHSGSETPRSRIEHFVNALSERLKAFGVTTQVIETISREIVAASESGNPMDLMQVRSRLAELGVKVDAVLPQPTLPGQPNQPGDPIMPTIMVTEPIAESILARLKRAEVDPEVIETISTEIWDAIELGRPLDLRYVRMRLEELGVDWDNPHQPPNQTPPQTQPGLGQGELMRRVLPLLGRLGISREIILTIYTEARAAAAAGTPWTFEQIVARLKELGISINAPRI